MLEVQVRTLPQQLWADESESFGERVKEGLVPVEIKDYLTQLSTGCCEVDETGTTAIEEGGSGLMHVRAPFSSKLPMLCERFEAVSTGPAGSSDGKSFITVYDTETAMLMHNYPYGPDERQKALMDYNRLTKDLNPARFEVIVLNSPTSRALEVTHPRLFLGINRGQTPHDD